MPPENLETGAAPEKKPENKEELAEALHNKSPLHQLRTYQGDIAEFIQSKDRSIADIALQNKEKKEKIEEGHAESRRNFLAAETPIPKVRKDKTTNFLIYILGGVLLVGALSVFSYIIYVHFKNQPVEVNISDNAILRSNRSISIDLDTFSEDNFYAAIAEARTSGNYTKGISGIDVRSKTSKLAITPQDFIDKMGWSMPGALARSISDQFLAGLYGDGKGAEFFIIFKVDDYGIAFRDMLSWENEMPKDFSEIIKLNPASTTDYQFKDVIVKNKDAREFSGASGKALLIYTFINQNTILITESEGAMTNLINSLIVGNAVR